MARGLTVSATDMRSVRDILNALHTDPGPNPIPDSALDPLTRLIPCNDISHVTINPSRRTLADLGIFRVDADGPNADEDGVNDLFWAAYDTDLVCRYPYQTKRVDQVLGAEDFMSDRELANSLTGELFRIQQVRFNIIMPLSLDGGTEERFELFRTDGYAFTAREKLLLTLLRPHFADRAHRVNLTRRHAALTDRQEQILSLVAQGLSNREIAAELVLAEGTVRRHLDNIYTRLGVRRRTAALAAVCVPVAYPEGHRMSRAQ